ncbi:glutathione S-transferase [Devosia sp.]|uniref:glutathione S-transferase n=1 Tax=Devosia sp. TaxID=1871048 RepID=UPI003A900FA1
MLYWSVPFRGQFVRAVLAFAEKSWTEAGDDQIAELMGGDVADMPVPFMGPPVLIDNGADVAISQMPAIILYLGETLELLPADPAKRALAIKVANDANDVIDELTIDGGREMWTEASWEEFVPRLKKWMSLWEDLGRRHGLTAEAGTLLGETQPGLADVVTATLWTTMCERFSKVKALFEQSAPATAGLAARVSALPALAQLAERTRAEYGDAYCGGDIGASMAKVLDA